MKIVMKAMLVLAMFGVHEAAARLHQRRPPAKASHPNDHENRRQRKKERRLLSLDYNERLEELEEYGSTPPKARINKVVMMKPVDRHTPQPTEKETERSFEQFLFPQESESLEVKRFSESKTNDDIPAAGMRRYDHNGLL